MSISIGERIKKIVKERGQNVEWLAKKLDISKQSLYKTLNKDSFNTDTLKKIADILEIPVGVFFMDEVDTAYDVLIDKYKDYGATSIIFNGIIGKTQMAISAIREAIVAKKMSIDQIEKALKELENYINEIMTIRAESIFNKMSPEEKKTVMFEVENLKNQKPDFDKMIRTAIDSLKSNQ